MSQNKQPDPPLTIDDFYEKTVKLNEVYQHNQRSLYDDFMRKQSALFERLSEVDRAEVVRREREKMQEAVNGIVVQNKDILDVHGKKMTTH